MPHADGSAGAILTSTAMADHLITRDMPTHRSWDVDIEPVSEESSVSDVLNKVTTGQANAGLVYVTDATSAGDKVTAVPFPESADAVNTYPMAILKSSEHQELARKFVDLVTGEAGQKTLTAAGFAKP